ncbi:MAG: hypothetical protein E6K80_06145 [Candidatus Eisenbacteria bacterium]|uniref:Uncharacterized protein n=1 Tax=Eiseniibacteriota bacterium TaxID=2212470 RepID=A0A538U5T7_UNCEI|nr:MAG: hypothetical protein E6K80_06145 [Candidatus Eisenbacteria bacterium]
MSGLLAVGLVLLVAVIAWTMRGRSVTSTPIPSSAPSDDDTSDEEVEDEADEELAITSDGAVFVPDGTQVRVIALEPDEVPREDVEAGMFATSGRERAALVARQKPGMALTVGDFTAARIRRGAADVVPWMLETLGRDGEYIPYPFETEDGARAALALLEKRRIVRRPLDENERPIPASPEDFEEARRRYDESWRALAMEQEPGEEPGPPYSDRR